MGIFTVSGTGITETEAVFMNDTTEYIERPEEFRHIKIDYDDMISYTKSKGIQPGELSDEEKDRFILNSSMAEIKKIWVDHGVIWK